MRADDNGIHICGHRRGCVATGVLFAPLISLTSRLKLCKLLSMPSTRDAVAFCSESIRESMVRSVLCSVMICKNTPAYRGPTKASQPAPQNAPLLRLQLRRQAIARRVLVISWRDGFLFSSSVPLSAPPSVALAHLRTERHRFRNLPSDSSQFVSCHCFDPNPFRCEQEGKGSGSSGEGRRGSSYRSSEANRSHGHATQVPAKNGRKTRAGKCISPCHHSTGEPSD